MSSIVSHIVVVSVIRTRAWKVTIFEWILEIRCLWVEVELFRAEIKTQASTPTPAKLRDDLLVVNELQTLQRTSITVFKRINRQMRTVNLEFLDEHDLHIDFVDRSGQVRSILLAKQVLKV